MSANNFRVVVNLSNFFSDHRHRARLIINEKIKTIEDFQSKITDLFGIENFFLTSQNEFLPPSEDVTAIRNDDIVWVMPDKTTNEIHSSNTEKKHSKRKASITTSALEETIKKKQRKKSLDIQADVIMHKQSKRDADTQIQSEEEEQEKYISSKKKKNSKRSHADISNQIENDSPKKSKKSANKYFEEIQTTQKKSENPKKKADSSKNISQVQYPENDHQVTVGNSLSEKVSLKKSAPIPIITEQYLKEKKINIVKIDYIHKDAKDEKYENLDLSTTSLKIDKQIPEDSLNVMKDLEASPVSLNVINNSRAPMVSLNVEKDPESPSPLVNVPSPAWIESKNNIGEGSANSTDHCDRTSEEKKQDKKIPITKFFFLNTPSSKEEKEKLKVKPKKSNMFKLKDDCFSKEILLKSYDLINCVNSKQDIDKSNDDAKDDSHLTNGQSDIDSSSFCNQKTNIITPDIRIVDSTTDVTDNCPLFNECSTLPTFEDLGQITPYLTNMLDTTYNNSNQLGISGLQVISSEKKSVRKQISGVGQLLGSIRKSDSSEVLKNSEKSDISEFVTKRYRTRKRKNKTKNITIEETLTPNQNSITITSRPLLVDACPKLHIKFSDNEENQENGQKEESVIYVENEANEIELVEENILKAPLMSNMVPKEGDIIAFKVLQISNNYTPEISTYIIGHVTQFSEESKMVTFEITFGNSQLDNCNGRFSLENKKLKKSPIFKEYLWSELIEPRLIHSPTS